jgi:hypothetical protein
MIYTLPVFGAVDIACIIGGNSGICNLLLLKRLGLWMKLHANAFIKYQVHLLSPIISCGSRPELTLRYQPQLLLAISRFVYCSYIVIQISVFPKHIARKLK